MRIKPFKHIMKIEFLPFLLEEVVFLGIRQIESKGGDLSLYRRYQEEKDHLYELSGDEQDKAFHKLNKDYFSLLGYSGFLFKIIDEFPLLLKELDQISFLKANRRAEEGSDLFFQSDNGTGDDPVKTLVFKILPDQFLDIGILEIFFRREFFHVHDMLDTEFGYKPSLYQSDENMMRYRLVQDRYMVLWQAYVDIRLSERYPDYDPGEIFPEMVQVFSDLSRKEVARILDGLKVCKWTHSGLLNIAKILRSKD